MSAANFPSRLSSAIALCQQGRLGEARPLLEALLAEARSPEEKVTVAMNLGALCIALNDPGAAEYSLRLAVALRPDIPEIHNNLGALYSGTGQIAEAAASFRRAIALRPGMPEAHYNLGRSLYLTGDRKGAIASYRMAIDHQPDYADAMSNLGGVLVEIGELNEALEVLDKGLKRNAAMPDAWNNLGQALRNLGRRDEALSAYGQAITLAPTNPVYINNLGVALFELGRISLALDQFEQVFRIAPNFAAAYSNAGLVRERQGRMDEAVACYRRAVELDPTSTSFHSNLLFALSYARALPPRALKQAHEEWNARHGMPNRTNRGGFANDRQPSRRLRIGYVSPDFREHAVACFIAPVLANHDRREVEVFAYSEAEREDAVTERLRRMAHHWRRTTGESNESVAQRIREDRIDVLVDLAGHTAGNRLKVFAMRPAPVQASYLGYFATTGLSSMDWWITDRVLNPEDTVEEFTENLFRLNRCWVCYEPDARAPEPALVGNPARPITFGSFNQLQKLSPGAIALWSRALRALPEARLLLKTRTLADGAEQERIRSAFAAEGVSPDRLELRGHSPSVSDHLGSYGEIDIALDPFPCNGGTTTADALWMGVPVLTRPGHTMIERMSASMLDSVGLQDWISANDDDFVAKAVSMAARREGLHDLRMGLRQRMRASPLCDGLGMARALEGAYRSMWRQWLNTSDRREDQPTA